MPTLALSDATSRLRERSSAAIERRWLGLAVVATAQLMIALDATVVNIALPSAQAALGFADADRPWIVTAYTLPLGGLLLVGGRLADSALGRRRALLIGLLGFGAASALSGAATTLGLLIGARALQGAFAALLAPTALSTLAVLFAEPGERARAFGIYGAIAASGGAFGLLLGGALTQALDWRWCLYVNVPIALIAAVGARAVLPDQQPPGSRPASPSKARFDLSGLVLGSVGLVAVVSGCGQAARLGWDAPLVGLLLVTGTLACGLFLRQEARSTAPLLPLHIVVDRQRGGAYLSALLAVAGMFGAFLFVTYELQVGLGFAPFQAGLACLPLSAASFVAGSLVAPRLVLRVPARALMAPGFLLAAGGMAVLARLRPGSEYLTGVLPAEVLLGLGIASVLMPASMLATSHVAPRWAGIASAALNSAQQLGASLGTAVLNTVAATTTAAALASGTAATHHDALVHGYATAAVWAAVLLLVGAMVALSIPNRGATRTWSPAAA